MKNGLARIARPAFASRRGAFNQVVGAILVLLIAVLVYLGAAVKMGYSRTAWLVNGTGRAYTVTIDGEPHPVAPHEVREISIGEGEHELAFSDTPLPVPPVTVNVDTSFFGRPFSDDAIIINPDQCAILVREQMVYTSDKAKVGREKELPLTVFSGKPLHIIETNYPFKKFPEEITVDSHVDEVSKSRLFRYEPAGLDDLLSIVRERKLADTPQQYLTYVANYARFAPTETNVIYHYSSIAHAADPQGMVAFLHEAVAARPLLIEWHRAYQSHMEALQPQHDLVAEYRAMLKKEPDEPGLHYLLGRVIDDFDKAKPHFLKAESLGKPIGYGYHAIAYQHLCTADYEPGLTNAAKAVAARPDVERFGITRQMLLFAAGRYGTLLDELERRKPEETSDWDRAALRIRYEMLLNRTAEAKKASDAMTATLRKQQAEAEVLKAWAREAKSLHLYYAGKYDEYAEHVAADEKNKNAQFEAALIRGDAAAADAVLQAARGATSGPYLLAYCVAKKAGDKQADALLERACELMAKASRGEKILGEMLQGTKPIDEACVRSEPLIPTLKRIVVTALGLAHPEHKDFCFEFARRLNYDRDFPYHLIAQAVGPETRAGR
jgi:hypothetical protein